ncbi:MAG: efflux RND transporter periplasmic adaptor subunit [Planctomycetes bacterium]|nr:efflux RND transporter periplasmic adaptor subunit [Planctomycetota bacterium]
MLHRSLHRSRTPPPLVAARLAAATLLAACATLAACSPAPSGGAPAAAPARPAREVRVATVAAANWPRTLRVSGELLADEESLLASKLAGRIATVAVELGARVAAGDPIVVLETRDFELRVAQAQAALAAARARLGLATDGDAASDPAAVPLVRSAQSELADARREHARLASLSGDGVASQAALDAAQARLEAAESALADAHDEVANRQALAQQRAAELALAEQALADATIRAPYAGTIAERLVDRGESVALGAAVARLVRADPIRLRLAVPESLAGELAPGLAVRLAARGGAPPRSATVTRLAPDLDRRNRTLRLEVDLANGDGALRPGEFVEAEIVVDPAATALCVPLEALVRFAGIDRVVLARDGAAREQQVTVGRIEGERVELLSGVAAGERVVLSPGALRTGDPLRVVE